MNFFSLIGDLYNYLFYQPIFNLLMGIYAPMQNLPMALAFAIILMTLLIRVLLVPVFMRQLKSSKAMQEIGPQVQALQRQYKQEPMVLQQELNKLYKEKGVNPYMGCLPLLIQLPFLWSVYGGLNAILGAVNAPNVAARVKAMSDINGHLYPFVKAFLGPTGLQSLLNPVHTSFLGINLAHTDPTFILPVLAAIGTFVQMRMSLTKKPQQKPGQPADPNTASMQMMQYIFPVMTLIFGLRFPAGLALYWVVTTAFTIGQQYFVNGRNWDGLLRGIPGLDPELRTAAAGAGSMLVAGPSRSPRLVEGTVAKASPPSAVKAERAAKADRAEKSEKNTTPAKGETRAPTTSGPEQEQSLEKGPSKPTRLVPPSRSTISRPLAAKTSTVRLVSNGNGANGSNGNGQSKPIAAANGNGVVAAPRTTRPVVAGSVARPTSGVKPKTASNGNGAKASGTKTPSRAKKGGR